MENNTELDIDSKMDLVNGKKKENTKQDFKNQVQKQGGDRMSAVDWIFSEVLLRNYQNDQELSSDDAVSKSHDGVKSSEVYSCTRLGTVNWRRRIHDLRSELGRLNKDQDLKDDERMQLTLTLLFKEASS